MVQTKSENFRGYFRTDIKLADYTQFISINNTIRSIPPILFRTAASAIGLKIRNVGFISVKFGIKGYFGYN